MNNRIDIQLLKGDYLGFTYNGRHSSDLGIIRVSSGNRYTDNIKLNEKDSTVDIPGNDGQYYFGSQFSSRDFNINFVFQDITEEQIQLIKTTFGDKKIHDLIFDEYPYKVYSAAVTTSIILKTVAFGEDNSLKYSGEGNIKLTSYNKYARSRFQFREDYNIRNIPEWVKYKDWFEGQIKIADNSSSTESYGTIIGNKNDLETFFQLMGLSSTSSNLVLTAEINKKVGESVPNYSNFSNWIDILKFPSREGFQNGQTYKIDNIGMDNIYPVIILKISEGNTATIKCNTNEVMVVKNKGEYSDTTLFMIDNRAAAIYALMPDGTKKEKLLNKYIISGDFFNLPIGRSALEIDFNDPIDSAIQEIRYNYLFI